MRLAITLTLSVFLFIGLMRQTQILAYDEQDLKKLERLKKHCPDCDLSGADLKGANLRSANLKNADLEGADLREADLEAANNDSL